MLSSIQLFKMYCVPIGSEVLALLTITLTGFLVSSVEILCREFYESTVVSTVAAGSLFSGERLLLFVLHSRLTFTYF